MAGYRTTNSMSDQLPAYRWQMSTKLIHTPVSEVIALELRRPTTMRPYLYTQIFAGLAYLVAGILMLYLSRLLRNRQKRATIIAGI
jgi:hypothetical protein